MEESPGLGLLPVETIFASPKTLVTGRRDGRDHVAALRRCTHTFPAYEIHLGRGAVASPPGMGTRSRPVFRIVAREGRRPPTSTVRSARA